MVSAVATRVLEALGETFVRRAGALLEPLVDGLTDPLADVDELLQPTERGWARGLDLEETPIPGWIGAATGTKVPGGLTLEQQRDFVRDRATWRRGSPQAIKGAVAQLLTGTRRVDLFERDGSPWHMRIRTYAAETAVSITEAELIAAAASQKPVGITVDVEVAPGATFDHFTAEHTTFDDFASAYETFDEASAHVPEEGTIP